VRPPGRGRSSRLCGGTSQASRLRAVQRSTPNSRATARMLTPWARSACARSQRATRAARRTSSCRRVGLGNRSGADRVLVGSSATVMAAARSSNRRRPRRSASSAAPAFVDQVEPVADLHGIRRALGRAVGVLLSAVAGGDLDAGVRPEPRDQRSGLPAVEHVDRPALAEQAEPPLYGPGQEAWLISLETEHGNARGGAVGHRVWRSRGRALRRCGPLIFWLRRGYFLEGRERLLELLALLIAQEMEGRAKVCSGAGTIAFFPGDYAIAHDLHSRA
jgi:hypothetical protein